MTTTMTTTMLLLVAASCAAIEASNKPPAFLDHMQSFMKAAEGHTDHYLRELETSLAPALKTLETQMGNTFGQVLDSVKRSHMFGLSAEKDNEEEDKGEQPTGIQVPGTRMHTFNEFLNQAFHERFGGGGPASHINPFAIFGSQTNKQWYEGPNVCISRKVIEKAISDNNNNSSSSSSSQEVTSSEENDSSGVFGFTFSSHFSSCKDGETFHECTTTTNHDGVERTVTVTHKCCYGYKRKPGGEEPGCEQMSLKPLRETLKDLKMDGFLGLVDALDDSEMLLKQNVTVFVPSNDAIEDFRYDLDEESNTISDDDSVVTYSIDDGLSSKHNQRSTKSLTILDNDSLDNIIRGHFVDGFIDTRDLNEEEKIETKMPGSKIRVTVYNTFPEKVKMANCARITSRDHYTTNGVAHIVDRVIMPATKTVAELIQSDVQLVKLAEVLAAAGMMQDLDEPKGHFTMFAPTNHAFAQMEATAGSRKMMERLKRGDACSRDILNNHLLPNVICSGIIDSSAQTLNMLGKYVNLRKDDQGTLYANNIHVTVRDIVATNGVLHIVEKVLLPESARSISKALNDTNRTHLLQLLDTAGLTESLDDLSNVTLLAPSEHLLQDHMTELSSSPEDLKQMLQFHTVQSKNCLCDLKNNQVLETVSGDSIRINTFALGGGLLSLMTGPQQIVTAQCKPLLASHSADVCGGSIHTISDIMEPSANTIMEALKTSGNHSKFLQLLEKAEGLMEQISSADGGVHGVFTVLAPSDDAFASLEPELLEKLEEDKDLAEETVKNHFLQGVTCCAGIPPTNGFFDLSLKVALSGKVMSVRRSYGGRLYAGGAKIAACDKMAANGVVHQIDSVILPERILLVPGQDSFPAQTLRSIFSFFGNDEKKKKK